MTVCRHSGCHMTVCIYRFLLISYSEDYVTSLPDFRTVPPSLVVYLDLEGERVAEGYCPCQKR